MILLLLLSGSAIVISDISDFPDSNIDHMSEITFDSIEMYTDLDGVRYRTWFCYTSHETSTFVIGDQIAQMEGGSLVKNMGGEMQFEYEVNESIIEYGFPIYARVETTEKPLIFFYARTNDSYDEIGILLEYENQTSISSEIVTGGDYNNSAEFFTIGSDVYLSYQNNDNYEIVRYDNFYDVLVPVFDLGSVIDYDGYTFAKDVEFDGNRVYLVGGYFDSSSYERIMNVMVFDITGDEYTMVSNIALNESIHDLTITENGYASLMVEELSSYNYRYYISQVDINNPSSVEIIELNDIYKYISYIGSEGDNRYIVGRGDQLGLITETSGDLSLEYTYSYPEDELGPPVIVWIETAEEFFVVAIIQPSSFASSMIQFHLYDEINSEYVSNLSTEDAFVNYNTQLMVLVIPCIVIIKKRSHLGSIYYSKV